MGQPEYLGDGVYAELDGYGIWLRSNVPNTDNIYIEPDVLDALNRFFNDKIMEQEREEE
jgi:hypothetical protein